jgi:FkbM family methyltransferase
MLHLRHNTTDELIWREVFVENEYRLPDRMDRWVVVDLGAHIGSFALACVVRGAHAVHCYEPDFENFNLLAEARIPRTVCHPVGVWRPDRGPREHVLLLEYVNRENRAALGFYNADDAKGRPVRVTSLDAILAPHHQVDLLKVDIEGAEYAALMTTTRYGWVRRIVGEWHTLPEGRGEADIDCRPEALLHHLASCGFEVSMERHHDMPDQLGRFWATRPDLAQ